MKGNIQPHALQSELQPIQETENQGSNGAFERIPVPKNDHGNGNPAAAADHIDQRHVLMGQRQKRPADPHKGAAKQT